MKWKFVIHPSVVRLCRNYLCIYCEEFLQALVVASPGLYVGTFFLIFEKKKPFPFIFSFLITWDPMRVRVSKRCSSYKSQSSFFQAFPEFSPQWSSQNRLEIFESLSSRFLTIVISKMSNSPLFLLYGETQNLNYLENELS